MLTPQLKLALEVVFLLAAALAAWKFLVPFARGIWNLRRGQADWDRVIDAEIDPILDRLDGGETVNPDEIHRIAANYAMRHRLYWGLDAVNRTDLFPEPFLEISPQAVAQMAYWLMHPNELACPPAEIQPVKIFDLEIKGRTAAFVVLRFRAPAGHSNADIGWMMGVAGPYFPDTRPYSCGCFSDFEPQGRKTHEELVHWYIKRMPEAVFEQKGGWVRPVL